MYRHIFLTGFTFMLSGGFSVSLADEGDARLRKRIVELEAENRALRKIIAGVQSAVKSVPEQSVATKDSRELRIIVLPDDWGDSELEDMRRVCASAARSIMAQLPDDGFAPIIVQRSNSGPITLYKRGDGYEHIVRLDTSNRAWAQLAYQFAHEFCHVVCNYREAKNPQLWFEETLCELASLYALRRMADEWKEHPPYSNWKSYSTSLASYADDRINKYEGKKESIAEFYRDNQESLAKTGTNRELNGYIATKLLPFFEASPGAWQALRYINLGPVEENGSFETYLIGWHNRVPERHKPFVRRIAREFEIEIATQRSAH